MATTYLYKALESQKPEAKKKLAASLKITLETFEIKVSEIAERTYTDRKNWYKRLNGDTDIKLLDVLVICECMDVDVIQFLIEMDQRYHQQCRNPQPIYDQGFLEM
ncbi:hypothetical protein Lepto7375DRAFT_7289 [Leptolyngbya sp. PCC 7375]|nr:hypothetical protein Lepto7375DRAFT_7289 [Leptolyngbya sp. PCC 7375]